MEVEEGVTSSEGKTQLLKAEELKNNKKKYLSIGGIIIAVIIAIIIVIAIISGGETSEDATSGLARRGTSHLKGSKVSLSKG